MPTGSVGHLTEMSTSKPIIWPLQSVVRIRSFQFIFPMLQIKANALISK